MSAEIRRRWNKKRSSGAIFQKPTDFIGRPPTNIKQPDSRSSLINASLRTSQQPEKMWTGFQSLECLWAALSKRPLHAEHMESIQLTTAEQSTLRWLADKEARKNSRLNPESSQNSGATRFSRIGVRYKRAEHRRNPELSGILFVLEATHFLSEKFCEFCNFCFSTFLVSRPKTLFIIFCVECFF